MFELIGTHLDYNEFGTLQVRWIHVGGAQLLNYYDLFQSGMPGYEKVFAVLIDFLWPLRFPYSGIFGSHSIPCDTLQVMATSIFKNFRSWQSLSAKFGSACASPSGCLCVALGVLRSPKLKFWMDQLELEYFDLLSLFEFLVPCQHSAGRGGLHIRARYSI